MITQKDILKLYRKYPSPPSSLDELKLNLISKDIIPFHNIEISHDSLIIISLEEENPFHEIPLKNITGIIDIENYIIIILRHSILFIDKNSSNINVHINLTKPTLFERIKNIFK